jgi:hypothetical protein
MIFREKNIQLFDFYINIDLYMPNFISIYDPLNKMIQLIINKLKFEFTFYKIHYDDHKYFRFNFSATFANPLSTMKNTPAFSKLFT